MSCADAFPVSGSTPYKIGGWVKTSGANEGRDIQDVFLDSAGDQTIGGLKASYITGTNGWTYPTANAIRRGVRLVWRDRTFRTSGDFGS